MKRILFLSTANLHVRHGGALATLAYYNAFRCLYGEKIELAMPSEWCYGPYSSAIQVPQRKRILTYLKFLQGRFHRYRDFFNDFLRNNSDCYEAVILNGGFCAGDMVRMFHSYGIKVVVIHHNYEPEYHMDNRTLPTLGGVTSYFIRKNESKAYRNADINAYLTKSDMELHEKNYGKVSSPRYLLGVFEPESVLLFPGELKNQGEKEKTIVITGSLNSIQTIRGITSFRNGYYEEFKRIMPDWKIILSGRNPDAKILQFASEDPSRITVIANPENIDDVISQGTIFLCPTNVGGGLKLRIMDGLRSGLPVLSHRVSSRGYELFFDTPFFQIYDDRESFSDGLEKLKDYIEKNADHRSEIAGLYRSEFSFEAGCSRVKKMMSTLIQ